MNLVRRYTEKRMGKRIHILEDPPYLNNGQVLAFNGPAASIGWTTSVNPVYSRVRTAHNYEMPINPSTGELCYDMTARQLRVYINGQWFATNSGG